MNKLIWNLNENVHALTTLRSNGVSKAPYNSFNLASYVGDNPHDVKTNLHILAEDLNINLNQIVVAKQEHTDILKEVTSNLGGINIINDSDELDAVDALYTKEKNLYLGIFHADCVPILGYAADKQIVFAIHSGWRGTAKAIVYKSLKYLIDKENCDPTHFHLIIGPCIASDDMQGDTRMLDLFKQLPIDIDDCYHELTSDLFQYDLANMCYKQALACNIPNNNIIISNKTTTKDMDDFFSYKLNKDCGRNMSLICLL